MGERVFPYRNVPTRNWVFENQLMVTGILTVASSRKQFASSRKKVIEKGEELVILKYIFTIDLLVCIKI